MPWVREGEGYRCLRQGPNHGYFVPPGSCPGCVPAAGRVLYDVFDEPAKAPPDGCMSCVEIERWLVAIAKQAAASADAIENPAPAPNTAKRKRAARPRKRRLDFHDHGAIAKHRENAIKAMRAAADFAAVRERRARVDAREKRLRGVGN